MELKLKNKKGIVTKIALYDDIDSMPYENYMHFQRNLILNDAVNSDLREIADRFKALRSAMHQKEIDRELLESKLNNLFQGIIYGASNFSYKSLAFACLLKKQKDFGKEALQKSVDWIVSLGITNSDIKEVSENVKKNFIPKDNDEVLMLIKQYL